ncbi:MAG TPA: hypothetical protein VF518_06500, partial [Polyangia bacterium]
MSAGFAFAGCGSPEGFNAPVIPLAQVNALVTGDLASVTPPVAMGDAPHLHVALTWGLQSLAEPFCIAPPEAPDGAALAAVMAAGCPALLRFVPSRVGVDVPIEPAIPATLDLVTLPTADLMVGDITGRIAYASFIVYDDRNSNGMLDLRHPPQHHHHDAPEDAPGPYDIVYGA